MEYTTFCSNNLTDLAKAMLKVQSELPPATKDATNPFTHSRYATLNSVLASCSAVLVKHGIWLTQIPVPSEPGYIALLTKLTHAETGQYQASLTVLPLAKNDCQGAGSAITYARRYALTAMLGMVTEDDDGEGAKAPQRAPAENAPMPAPVPASEQPAAPPKLPGVRYEIVTGSDGRDYQIATGNTRPCKDALRAAGFRWDAGNMTWWRLAAA